MAKTRKRFLMGPQALSLRQKVSLPLLLMRNASTARRRDIGLGTVRSTWSIRRRRRRRKKKKKKKKGSEISTSGINVIEINTAVSEAKSN
jgi:hypothetical protein